MDSEQPEVVENRGMVAPPLLSLSQLIAVLPPKGACWYCDKPLDAVRRFCCKSCGVAYAEEAQYNS
jgi:predicted amidophosphoribosyltransferase